MNAAFFQVAIWVLLLASVLCLHRIGRGPTAPDRAVAIDILGTLVVGFCCILGLRFQRDFFITVAIAWALISFIGTIALAKYLEGRHFDE